MAWILAYDISCPRRWRRLYRLARQHGVRLQWSVFLISDARFDPHRFLAEAARIIDHGADDVRLYRVAGALTGSLDRRSLTEPIEGVQWRGPPKAISRFLPAENSTIAATIANDASRPARGQTPGRLALEQVALPHEWVCG